MSSVDRITLRGKLEGTHLLPCHKHHEMLIIALFVAYVSNRL